MPYFNKFFARRTDLHKTINTILITHDHIDHDYALGAVIENFTVDHYVDNGLLTGPGAPNPTWLRSEVTSGHFRLLIGCPSRIWPADSGELSRLNDNQWTRESALGGLRIGWVDA